jgi:hypothetical protein
MLNQKIRTGDEGIHGDSGQYVVDDVIKSPKGGVDNMPLG